MFYNKQQRRCIVNFTTNVQSAAVDEELNSVTISGFNATSSRDLCSKVNAKWSAWMFRIFDKTNVFLLLDRRAFVIYERPVTESSRARSGPDQNGADSAI